MRNEEYPKVVEVSQSLTEGMHCPCISLSRLRVKGNLCQDSQSLVWPEKSRVLLEKWEKAVFNLRQVFALRKRFNFAPGCGRVVEGSTFWSL